MGSCRFAALVVLLLVSALLPHSASARVLQGEKPSSGEGAPAPAAAATGGSEKSAASKESGQSSTATQEPQTNTQKQETQPAETAMKDSPPPPPGGAEDKGQGGGAAQESSQPAPPENVQASPPPPGSEATGGTDPKGGSSDKEKPTEEGKEALKKCVEDRAGVQCLIAGKLLACLLVNQTASTGSIAIQNAGENNITVNVTATSDISIEQQFQRLNLTLTKGDSKTVNISYSDVNAGNITLNVGNEHCFLRTVQQTDSAWQQPLPDWQQKFQQIAAYATNMDPIYGAYLFVFTVVLVGVVFACCKFARRRRNSGVPYQQLEMGSQAPNPSSANNTTSTADGWDDGWDDDWDDEEAPAKPSDTRPAGSVSANGLSSRSQTNSKDGWDVDWDD